MMKTILFLITAILCLPLFAQEGPVTFDRIVPKYIYLLSTNGAAEQSNEYESEVLDQYKAFRRVSRIRNDSIAAFQYLKKPSDHTLVAHFLSMKILWNSFNRGEDHLSPKEVIGRNVNLLPERYELLAHYYNSVFSHLLNNQRQLDKGDTDIRLDELNFSNDTEKAIFFLCAMRYLGNQVTSYSSGPRFPDNCFRGKRLVANMPTFDGKIFYQFELPEFEDFEIELDKRYPKMSFRDNYLPKFEEAIKAYQECLKVEED